MAKNPRLDCVGADRGSCGTAIETEISVLIIAMTGAITAAYRRDHLDAARPEGK